MIYSIEKPLILEQLKRQLQSLFLVNDAELQILDLYYDQVLIRCEHCFGLTPNKYYHQGDEAFFSPYVTTQYTIFLYYFSNTIYRQAPLMLPLCDKLYYLNKSLNAADLFYPVALPDFFMCEHPVGSVIGGSGVFGDGFLFYQNCTVGGFHLKDGSIIYPTIGRNVRMYANSMIIGRCTIGDNVKVGARAMVKNEDIPSDSVVFGQSPNLIIKPLKKS